MTDGSGRRETGVQLLRDLEAFFLEHRWCGEVDSEVTAAEPAWVLITCSCGAEMVRAVCEEGS